MTESEQERLQRLLTEHIPGWNDPENVKKRQDRDDELERIHRKRRESEAPYVQLLRDRGFVLKSVWDLVQVHGALDLTNALDILLEVVQDESVDEWVRSGAARAMGTKAGHSVYDELVSLLRHYGESTVGEGLAAAIADLSVADSDLPLLIELLNDEHLGGERLLFIERIARLRPKETAEAAIVAALADEGLELEAAKALRKTFGYSRAEVVQAQKTGKPR
ncbi:hypothetical protein QE370_000663 [Aeromicrobium sp. SORGH_AS981]|uniref:hypothetical protein n=1 Tax=Aeromicrobium sp. SORGH_AS_0981 TaxID=3041802 RepID=UPI00285B41D3|nr:hypothetical protein [Aeromicrobium sp. SORGH_AS_0981]MDR6117479.1 hypothetical protein [Aeromicrobium sp. SORGH_AS_0981]